jgi:hypothetical protein
MATKPAVLLGREWLHSLVRAITAISDVSLDLVQRDLGRFVQVGIPEGWLLVFNS